MRWLNSALLICVLSVFSSPSRADVIAYINVSGGNLDGVAALGHSITYFNNPIDLTLNQLTGFDAIIVTSNGIFTQPENIGNVAADFADTGRGVVLTMFSIKGMWQVGGRIASPAYSPLTFDPLSDSNIGITSITVHDPQSPLLDGVNAANVQGRFISSRATLNPDAVSVASWFGSSVPAVAYMPLSDSSVVALNMFPGDGFSWAPNADSHRLISNAAQFSQVVPEPSLLPLAIGCAMFWMRRRR